MERAGTVTIRVVSWPKRTVHVGGKSVDLTRAGQGALIELTRLLKAAPPGVDTATSMEIITARMLAGHGLIEYRLDRGRVWASLTPDGVAAYEELRGYLDR